ncbi:MAG: RNA polymerase subunit sigma [Lachnospiraceae bacterium]
MFELDARVADITGNPGDREILIQQYKPFILKCASESAKHYVTDADDEWSIALHAFSEALDQYRIEKGHFLSFAKLVISRRLYDYFVTNYKYSHEIPVSPSIFSGEDEENTPYEISVWMKESLICEAGTAVTEEIEAANEVFVNYGFSFFDLMSVSPKAAKTKLACKKAIVYLLKHPLLIAELQKSRQLPLQLLVEETQISRKILERHRKYIIAVVELFFGVYPCLTDYLCHIKEELNR